MTNTPTTEAGRMLLSAHDEIFGDDVRLDVNARIIAIEAEARGEHREEGDPLLDEMSERWVSVERTIWPDGPAHGHGSGAYAGLKAEIIARLRKRAELDVARLARALEFVDTRRHDFAWLARQVAAAYADLAEN